MTDKHTPTPWKISEQSIAGYGKKEHARLYIEGKKGKYVCNIGNTDSLANAKLIVDSVNKVQQYREALEKILLTAECHTQYGVKDELRLEALRVCMQEAGYILKEES